MNDQQKQQQSADELEQHLKDMSIRHGKDQSPLEQTADALMREAHAADTKLDASVSRTQRAMLMQLAKKQKETTVTEKTAEAPEKKPVFRKASPWLAWVGGAATVIAVLFAAVFVQNTNTTPLFKATNTKSVAAIARLVIPEASAADAFSITAEKTDASGADPATAFLVKTTVPVTAQDVHDHVRIVPAASVAIARAVDVTVEQADNGQFRVRPVEPLQPGTVYTVSVDTAVKKTDGELQAHDFRWAIQTKNIFRVLSSIPAREASYVPVNTGIEFVMSMSNWEDPAANFEIKPATPGKFETHGRSLVFIPSKPLNPGQLYIATLKKGLKVKGSESVLEQDEVLRFETEAQGNTGSANWGVSLQQPFMTVAPGKEILVPFWADDRQAPEITVTGFGVGVDEAKRLMVQEGKIPLFAELTRARGDAFRDAAKVQSFQFKADIQKENYQAFLKLPAINEGRYVVKVEPKLPNTKESWFFLQVTKTAAYVISDKDATVVWAMDTESSHPRQDLDVRDGLGHAAKTDASGIARMPTPVELASSTSESVVVLELGNGEAASLVRLINGEFRPWDRWNTPTDSRTMSFFMPDRPLYHPTDALEVFGKATDRDTQKSASGMTIELQRSGFYDWFTSGKEKVYQSAALQLDEQGAFRASMSWQNLQPGYYQLILKRDGVYVRSRSIEIRDFVKPAYTIEVTPDRQAVFNGESVKMNVRARFFEGTPVSDLSLGIAMDGAVKFDAANASTVKTDADGNASFMLPTRLDPCLDDPKNGYCPDVSSANVTLRPVDAEQGEIAGTASIRVWRARVSLQAEVKNSKENVANITLTARTVDLSKASQTDSSDDVLGEARRGLTIGGRIVEATWVRHEYGTSYDFIQKKVVPTYTYEQVYRDIAPVNAVTDASGKATINVPLAENVSYLAILKVKDEAGNEQITTQYLARDGYYSGYPAGENDIRLDVPTSSQNQNGYAIGEQVTFELLKGTERMPEAAAPTYLFVKANRGIKDAKASTSPVYQFSYGEKDVPNVSIRGIVFVNGGFLERQSSATFDLRTRELKVEVTPDATSYAPGAKAKVHVKVTDKQGNPAAFARTGLTVVDEALYAAANTTGEEDVLGSLYAWVEDGILVRVESHAADAAELFRAGGAEMGGGGMGDVVRRNFKDTAYFQNVTLDSSGQADVEFSLPDNLTSWRATAVALGSNGNGGSNQAALRVTKPVFVEAVLPSMLLRADKPVLKLRAYGTSLEAGAKLSFNLDAPSLGLKQSFDGIAGTPTYIAIDKLSVGDHAVTIGVKTDKGSDAIEKHVQIVPSRFLRSEAVSTDLSPGSSLPEAAESREVDISFLPKSRAQYLDRVQALAFGWSERVESQVAANIARDLLKQQFAQKDVAENQSVAKYQKSTGGIAILPYASEDVELSAKIAALAPDQFDRVALSRYFYETAKKSGTTREQQVRAISGLASLGEPVLPELKAYAEQKDLAWREQLALAQAATAIGDQDLAKAMLAPFFARMEEHDGQSFIRVSDDKREQIEATTEMAVIAAKLGLSQASRLDAWLQTNWANDAFTDLDRIAYLQTVVPAALGGDVRLAYTLGNGERTLELAQGRTEFMTLTADELKNFRVTSVNGPVTAVYIRLIAAPATEQSKDLGLERTISAEGKSLNELHEGDKVNVTLRPRFASSAPSGCYLLRDHVPAGFAPMVNLSFAEYKEVGAWYPQDIDGNAVSFTICNNQDGKTIDPIVYPLRVVARGTYQAEPAILQSDTTPSVSVTAPATTVEIK